MSAVGRPEPITLPNCWVRDRRQTTSKRSVNDHSTDDVRRTLFLVVSSLTESYHRTGSFRVYDRQPTQLCRGLSRMSGFHGQAAGPVAQIAAHRQSLNGHKQKFDHAPVGATSVAIWRPGSRLKSLPQVPVTNRRTSATGRKHLLAIRNRVRQQ